MSNRRRREAVNERSVGAGCREVGGGRRGLVYKRGMRPRGVEVLPPFGGGAAGVVEAEKQLSFRSSAHIRPLKLSTRPFASACQARFSARPVFDRSSFTRRFQHLVGQQLLQLRVLVFRGQAFGIGYIQPAIPRRPIYRVALAIPYLRARLPAFAPASCSRRTVMICSSVNRFRFISPSFNRGRAPTPGG